jgi:hypothetical protein
MLSHTSINGVSFKAEYGPSFSPEEVANLAVTFNAVLRRLGLIDRKEPTDHNDR